MVSLTKITARDFGEALKTAREEAGATVEAISDRTKISRRMLTALESGEFGKLPDLVFAKMFLRQYLDFIGAAPDRWLQAFDVAWRRSAESSQSFVVRPAVPMNRKRRTGPWIVGLLLVATGVVGVLLVEKRPRDERDAPLASVRFPTPAVPTPVGPTVPAAPAVPAAPEPASRPDTLLIRAGKSPCWVGVRVAGGASTSRLLTAGAVWEVSAGGKDVDLVLGDAGAVTLEYLGQTQSPAGRPGEVAHIHLTGSSPAPVRP
ncbi:MAG: RodZ domain-containing protein [Thermoanaerobaculaceae bacterium]|jgi:cytoskeleton protein RodZ